MAITPLKMAAAGVAMLTLLITFAIQRIPVPEPAAAAEHPSLKKTDRLQIASVEPKPVTERMPPAPNAPVSVPPVIMVQDDDDKPPAARHRRHSPATRNVCTRHHMHKVMIRGGKSWRCRK